MEKKDESFVQDSGRALQVSSGKFIIPGAHFAKANQLQWGYDEKNTTK